MKTILSIILLSANFASAMTCTIGTWEAGLSGLSPGKEAVSVQFKVHSENHEITARDCGQAVIAGKKIAVCARDNSVTGLTDISVAQSVDQIAVLNSTIGFTRKKGQSEIVNQFAILTQDIQVKLDAAGVDGAVIYTGGDSMQIDETVVAATKAGVVQRGETVLFKLESCSK